LLSFFWTAAIPAYAQTDGQGGLAPALEKNADPIEKLEMLQRKLEQDRERQRRLDERKSALEAEMGKLQAQLVDAAGEAAALERRQSDAETKLAELSIQERSAETAFLEKRDKLAGLLAVLQRMGREPPPALLVQPGNAADAARSAMVLTTVLPSVRTDAQNLGRALAELRALRQAAAKTKIDLGKANEQLASQRTHIAALLTDKNKLADETSSELRAAGARVQTLSREVQDVSELIRRVKGEVKALTDSGFSAAQFAARRGQLPWPAAGEIVANFGEDNELGLRNDGIAVKTRPNAQVVSPVDGKIAFAGPFPGYGNMLIIVAGDDYHIVLSGMEAIYGAAGQPLLAGEPVGKMGAQVQGGARLGIEFRHGRNPVDPKPWFGARNERILDKGQG
jgi:septal ring factor EnvC (AmiA/AmiB activator)